MSARVAALERRVKEIGPSIIKAIEERFGGRHTDRATQRGPPEHPVARSYASVAKVPPPPPSPPPMRKQGAGRSRKWWSPEGREERSPGETRGLPRKGQRWEGGPLEWNRQEGVPSCGNRSRRRARSGCEQRRKQGGQRTNSGNKNGYSPLHTADIRSDSNIKRGIQYDLCRSHCKGQAERPTQ